MHVLIAGCGYVGTRLAKRLADRGHAVSAVRRSRSTTEDRIDWISADLLSPASIQLKSPVDILVLAAGLRRDAEAKYAELFCQGYPKLIRHLQQSHHPLQRIIMVSTTGVCAESNGGWVDELSPVTTVGLPGKYYVQAESEVLACGTRAIIARLSGIYGPQRIRLINEVRDGLARILPPPPHYLNQIHAEDAAGALEHLIHLDDPERIYLLSDRAPSERNEVLQWIANKLNMPSPAEGHDEDRPARRSGNKRISSGRLHSSGYTFIYPTFREGYAALMASQDV